MPKFSTHSDDGKLMDSGSHISSIVSLIHKANPEIQTFTAVEYLDPSPIQDRILQIEETDIFKEATKLRDQTLIPFWDATLAQALHGPLNVKSIIKEAIFHNCQQVVTHQIESETAEVQLLKLVSRDWLTSTLALSSKVVCESGLDKHIPMLDFHVPSNRKNYETVIDCLNALAIGKFVIVNSGKSFHAYGLTLLDANGLKSLLYTALLLSPIVDSRYIAHQLRESQCKLRIARTPRKPTEPIILGTT